jgi:hypothetical protein
VGATNPGVVGEGNDVHVREIEKEREGENARERGRESERE